MDAATQQSMLRELWSLSPGRYVSLPTHHRAQARWNNGPMFDKDDVKLSQFWAGDELDLYFSPLTYDKPEGRRRSNLKNAGVIYADMDAGRPPAPPLSVVPRPNLVVASGSPGHEHWYWFLDAPAPIEEWELYARGTTEALGADPGGWDSTQVLRIPGSLNHKHDPPTKVQVLSRVRGLHSIRDFPKTTAPPTVTSEAALPPLPNTSSAAVQSAIEWAWPMLPVEDKLLLAGREKARDRSKVIWRQIQDWRGRLGFSEDTIYRLLVRAPHNKYSPEKLWAQIHK